VGVVSVYGDAGGGAKAGELSPRPTPGDNAGELGSDTDPLIDGGAKFGDGTAAVG